MPPESLLAQWRDINQRANELERKLFEDSLLYTRGKGPKPTTEQWEEAEALRKTASEYFRKAMDQIDDAATAARLGIYKPRGGGSDSSGTPMQG